MQLRIKDIADNANMIINGYAYTKDGDYIRVLNLNCLNNATVIYNDEIVETNMDDIEIQIVLDYYNKNKEFMEETAYCKTSINGMEIYGCLNCKRKRRCYYLEQKQNYYIRSNPCLKRKWKVKGEWVFCKMRICVNY